MIRIHHAQSAALCTRKCGAQARCERGSFNSIITSACALSTCSPDTHFLSCTRRPPTSPHARTHAMRIRCGCSPPRTQANAGAVTIYVSCDNDARGVCLRAFSVAALRACRCVFWAVYRGFACVVALCGVDHVIYCESAHDRADHDRADHGFVCCTVVR